MGGLLKIGLSPVYASYCLNVYFMVDSFSSRVQKKSLLSFNGTFNSNRKYKKLISSSLQFH